MLTGCGAAPSAPVPASAAAAFENPCILLTLAEIEAAVGYTTTPGEPDTVYNPSCIWEGQGGGYDHVQVVLDTGGTDTFKVLARFPFPSYTIAIREPLSGIGDEAAQATKPSYTGATRASVGVVFRTGDIVVHVYAHWATPGAAVILAKLILSRL